MIALTNAIQININIQRLSGVLDPDFIYNNELQ